MNEIAVKYLKGILDNVSTGIPSKQLVRRIDDQGTICYVGYSIKGLEESDEEWSIKKISDTSIEYAQGAWINRLTLNYV